MRVLADIPNVNPPDSDYVGGRIRNKNTSVAPVVQGTPIVEEIYGDIVQFFQKLVSLAGITPNALPDNTSNEHQLLEAAIKALNGGLKTITVPLGDWNMLSPGSSLEVYESTLINTYGLSNLESIRTIQVLIIEDSDSDDQNTLDFIRGGVINIRKQGGGDARNIALITQPLSIFNSTDFDMTSYNRGYMTISYVPDTY